MPGLEDAACGWDDRLWSRRVVEERHPRADVVDRGAVDPDPAVVHRQRPEDLVARVTAEGAPVDAAHDQAGSRIRVPDAVAERPPSHVAIDELGLADERGDAVPVQWPDDRDRGVLGEARGVGE